jgi:hypothetical protein
MKTSIILVRTLLGLAFVVFGLEFFFGFLGMPQPTQTPEAGAFTGAMYGTGYLHVVKILEITGGVMLLTGLFVPLGLVLLTPVIVNIALYDLLLMHEPKLGVAFLALAIFVIWGYRAYFAPLFTAFAHPGSCTACERACSKKKHEHCAV